MKKGNLLAVLKTVLAFFIICYLPSAFSVGLQRLDRNVYDSPTILSLVKNKQIVVGTLMTESYTDFNGTINRVPGKARTQSYIFPLPYFRYAYRFNDKTVASLDIATVETVYDWPENSFVRTLGTLFKINQVMVTGKLSYKVNNNFFVGGGLDFNRISQFYIDSFVPNIGYLQNRGAGYGVGFHANITYVPCPTTYLDLTYFSNMVIFTAGTSTAGRFVNTHFYFNPLPATRPTTALFQLTQIFSPKLLASLRVGYTLWNADRILVFNNTALGKTVVPFFFHNTWYTALFTKYTINDQWALNGAAAFDQTYVDPAYNLVSFPTGNTYSIVFGPSYFFDKKTFEFKVLGTYGYANSRSDLRRPTAIVNARLRQRVYSLNTGLTINL